MLRWTKDSSAAHGVLAIFLLLLSASQGIPIVEDQEVEVTTEQPTETTAATTIIPAPTERRIRNFSWKSDLESPCPPSFSSRQITEVNTEQRKQEIFRLISERSSVHLNVAHNMLNQSFIPECKDLPIDPVDSNPTLQELQAMNSTEAVKAMYASVLRCTAYAFFILDQQKTYAHMRCSNNSGTEREWTALKNGMKFVACIFHELIPNDADQTNYFDDVTQGVLDERLSDQGMCSRRNNRNCQMLKSIIHALDVVSTYSSSQAAPRR